ncbi:MAG: hypothetical protein DRN49_04025 [Thaumarchaeota archaeon]|nr:MAG: hypothetical protein DRN49_04025 [Nitrososphaerota archaeon]
MEPSAIVFANMGKLRGGSKGLFAIAGKPMIEYVLDSIPDEVSDILIAVENEENISEYQDLADQYLARVVVSGSRIGDFRREIEFAVNSIKGDRFLVLPCDAPLITMEFTKFLVDASQRFPAVLPRTPSRRVSYLTASYQKKPLEEIFKSSPDLGMEEVVRKLKGAVYLSSNSLKIFDERLNMFFRVNCKADVDKAERFLRKMLR